MDNLIEIASVIRRILLLFISVYLIITAILYIFQSSLIFFRQPVDGCRLDHINSHYPEAEEVRLQTHDEEELHGWIVNRAAEKPAPLLIYFGGNAEEVSWMIEETAGLKGWAVLLVNYRGYGKSSGRPGEKALLNDAFLLYDSFAKRDYVDNNKIAVMGRSIGTAMAVYLSANRDLAKTILVSPFGSMADIAGDNFPFIPVKFMMKHQFNVLSYARYAPNPMLTLVASNDNIIPAGHSKKLYKAWQGAKSYHVIQNANHNNISANPAFWHNIYNFLNKAGNPDF